MGRAVASLALALCAAACGRSAPSGPPPPTPASIDRALAAAGAFLAAQQSPDGALRSHTYSALEDGWSLTPLAAMALRFVPAQQAAYRRAVDFLAGPPPAAAGLAYPIYTYAIGALVLGAVDNVDTHRAARDRFLDELRGRQLADGGWGYDPATSNLSTTLLAVGALALSGVPATDPALVKARAFVARCHNADGGFFFAPDNLDGNKAGVEGGIRSYGSMTADGVRALLRLGAPPDDAELTTAIAWLDRAFDPEQNPGDFVRINEIRRASSYFYWAWTAAHALEHVHRDDPRWATALAAALLRRQGADGAWRNHATEMREDDPIIATSFAVAALALCRGVLVGERPAHASFR